MVGLPDGEKCLRICVTVYTQYRRVTDGHTSCHGIVRHCIYTSIWYRFELRDVENIVTLKSGLEVTDCHSN